jgi:hypothetical protein
MRHLACVLIATACSHDATVVLANRASPRAPSSRPACPADPNALVRPWRLGSCSPDAQWSGCGARDLRVRCTGGNFGKPGWFVYATYESEGQTMAASGILAADGHGELVAHSVVGILPWNVDEATYQAADLDGDGTDELVEVLHESHRGFELVTASVLRLRGGTLEEIDGPLVSYDDSAREVPSEATSCEGELALRGRQLVITMKNRKGDLDRCLAVGQHAFELRGAKLMER